MNNLSISLKKPLLRFSQLGTSSRHPQGAETTAQATGHRLRCGFPSLREQSETVGLSSFYSNHSSRNRSAQLCPHIPGPARWTQSTCWRQHQLLVSGNSFRYILELDADNSQLVCLVCAAVTLSWSPEPDCSNNAWPLVSYAATKHKRISNIRYNNIE